MSDLPLKDIRTWDQASYGTVALLLGLVAGSDPRHIDPTPWARGDVFGLNTTSGSAYTFVTEDQGKLVMHSHATACTLTIAANSLVAFPVNARIRIIQAGAGKITFAPASGVTLRARGNRNKTAGQYAVAELIHIATNEWVLTGDLNS